MGKNIYIHVDNMLTNNDVFRHACDFDSVQEETENTGRLQMCGKSGIDHTLLLQNSDLLLFHYICARLKFKLKIVHICQIGLHCKLYLQKSSIYSFQQLCGYSVVIAAASVRDFFLACFSSTCF